MRNLLVILVLSLSSFFVNSQDSVRVIDENTIEVTQYDEYGNLREKGECFIFDGKAYKTGVWISYHPNGTVSSRVEFKDGLRHGESKYYTFEGKLLAIVQVKRGVVKSYTTVIDGELVVCGN